MNAQKYVLEALSAAVEAAVNNAYPVKYVGVTFNPPSSTPWWEMIHIPNNLEGEFWGSEKTYRGVVRLILHWPMKNTPFDGEDEVARVSNYFEKGLKLTDTGNNVVVTISEDPNENPPMEEPPEFLIPLTVRYTCFKV